jgi:fatty acid desaturase
MITYLSHTHPDIPKYSPKEWTFVLGATATMDRSFGFIGTHFFHHISTDHVTHHLFSKIPHYYLPDATKAIVPLLGKQYKNGVMSWKELKLAFSRCQWVEENVAKDDEYFGTDEKGDVTKKRPIALWYRGGRSPLPEYRMRYTSLEKKLSDVL